MVNEIQNIKNEIIKLLHTAEGKTISGVSLSETLGISRVAVWKHISALKENGIDIVSGPKGYAFSKLDDVLLPVLFKKPFQNSIFHFNSVKTTMDKARTLARNDAAHLSVVVAEKQTAGRGRLNRKWESSRGGLWFTLILKPQTPPPLAYIYNFIASSSLSTVLDQLFGLPVKVKWPNDLLLGNKKLAGLLSEMETRSDMVDFINIGIGLNVNNHPDTDEFSAVSLADALGQQVCRRSILEAFLEDFSERIKVIEPEQVIKNWKKQTSTIGSRVQVETPGKLYSGKAVDVDETGALILEEASGQHRKIIYGDCFHA